MSFRSFGASFLTGLVLIDCMIAEERQPHIEAIKNSGYIAGCSTAQVGSHSLTQFGLMTTKR